MLPESTMSGRTPNANDTPKTSTHTIPSTAAEVRITERSRLHANQSRDEWPDNDLPRRDRLVVIGAVMACAKRRRTGQPAPTARR